MSESLIYFQRIAHLLILGQKTSDSLGKPMSEFPALPLRQRSYAEVVGGRIYLLESTMHVYVWRGAVGGPLENSYSGPFQVVRREKKILPLQLGSR